jgi:PAS domain S-box-containing protein
MSGTLALSRALTERASERRPAVLDVLEVLDVLDDGVLVVEILGGLVHANRTACEVLGLELASARADPTWWRELAGRFTSDGSPLDLGALMMAGEHSRDVGIAIDRADGTSVSLRVDHRALHDDEGVIAGTVLLLRDITVWAREPSRAVPAALARQMTTMDRVSLQATLDSQTAPTAVLDERGEVILTNRAWIEFGVANDGGGNAGSAQNYLDVCDRAAEDPWATRAAVGLRAILAGARTEFSLEYPCHGPAVQRWFSLRAARFAGPGEARMMVAHEDVTLRRRIEGRLATQAALLDEVDVAVVAIEPDGRVTHWNRCAERLYGWTAGEAVGRSVAELIVPADDADSDEILAELRRVGHWEGEFTVCRKDGSTFRAYVRDRLMLDADGLPAGMIGVSVDITQRVAAERSLRAATNYIRAVADNMGEGLFTLDTEGRVNYMNRAAEGLLDRRFEDMAGQIFHDVAHALGPDGSAGAATVCPIVSAGRDGLTVRVEDDVFIRGDGHRMPVAYTAAPFETEDGVEGSVVVFEDITGRKAREESLLRDAERLAWIDRTRDALAQDRLVLYAQPIVDLQTGVTVQRELLLRMREPNGEIVGPGEFLHIAEKSGLISEIDRWVIRRSAEIAATGLAVEVNLSARSLGDSGVLEYIERCIERTGADPAAIVFEITETAIVEDAEAARVFADRLHELGCKLALDDFGTGYGGFTYLKHLPVDYLKIDIEFVSDLATNPASRHVVEAVVALSRGFELKTVAEGVEDRATFELLRELGVDFAQGFHIARPEPLDHGGALG